MKRKAKPAFDLKAVLATVGAGRTIRGYRENQTIFSQGDRADAVYFVERGKVTLTVLSRQGKQAVIALLGPGNFFGEGCLAGQPLRMSTATAMADSLIILLPKHTMIQALRENAEFSETFTTYLLSRNIRIEEDLVDQLFNSSEKRLARILLLLANFGKEGRPELVVPKISQETLAEMVGTTRSRVSFFMNKFRSWASSSTTAGWRSTARCSTSCCTTEGMGGPRRAPHAPRRSERRGAAVALLGSPRCGEQF